MDQTKSSKLYEDAYNRALINCQSRKLGLCISLLKRILERELHIPLKDRKQYQKELDHIYSIKVEIPKPNESKNQMPNEILPKQESQRQ